MDFQSSDNHYEAAINPPNVPSINPAIDAKFVKNNSTVHKIGKFSALLLIASAFIFAVIAILAVWGVLGNSSEAVWKALASLAILTFSLIVVNIGARLYEDKKK